jgi:cytochrome P450
MTSMTFGMVARSLFHARMAEREIDGISRAITTIQAFMVRRIVQPYLAPWFAMSGQTRRHHRIRKEGEAILLRYIRSRRTTRRERLDLLQLLLDAVDPDTGREMTEEQVLHESMQLLVAGHETSSTALTWALYLLCLHPSYLHRARHELDTVVGDAQLEYAHVSSLPLTSSIVEEALRLYPPFWMVDRVAIENDRVAGIDINRGTTVIAFIYGAHHSPRHWKDPEDFYPERFIDCAPTDHGFSLLPFGGGPRGCVGANYAMLQMLMILDAVLTRYEISLVRDSPAEMQPMLILRPSGGMPAHVRRRAYLT